MTSDPVTCVCGDRYCANRDRAFFGKIQRLRRSIRAVVFRWPDRHFWTWCPLVNGEPEDVGLVMGHYRSLQRAYADADAWARGHYPADAEHSKAGAS